MPILNESALVMGNKERTQGFGIDWRCETHRGIRIAGPACDKRGHLQHLTRITDCHVNEHLGQQERGTCNMSVVACCRITCG